MRTKSRTIEVRPKSFHVNWHRSIAEGFTREDICGECGLPLQGGACANAECLAHGLGAPLSVCWRCGDYWPYPNKDFVVPESPSSVCVNCARKLDGPSWQHKAWNVFTVAAIAGAAYMVLKIIVFIATQGGK